MNHRVPASEIDGSINARLRRHPPTPAGREYIANFHFGSQQQPRTIHPSSEDAEIEFKLEMRGYTSIRFRFKPNVRGPAQPIGRCEQSPEAAGRPKFEMVRVHPAM